MSTLASPAFPHATSRAMPAAPGADTPPLRLLERRPYRATAPMASPAAHASGTTAQAVASGWLDRLAMWADAHPPQRQAGGWVRL